MDKDILKQLNELIENDNFEHDEQESFLDDDFSLDFVDDTFDDAFLEDLETDLFADIDKYQAMDEAQKAILESEEFETGLDTKELIDSFDEIGETEVDRLIQESMEQLELEMQFESDDSETHKYVDYTLDTLEGDALIEAMIEREGLLIDPKVLEEAGVNQVRLSHEAKRRRIESQSAMILAKEANDIMYTRYVKFNRLRKQLKEQIKSKYAAQARVRAREVMERNARKRR